MFICTKYVVGKKYQSAKVYKLQGGHHHVKKYTQHTPKNP